MFLAFSLETAPINLAFGGFWKNTTWIFLLRLPPQFIVGVANLGISWLVLERLLKIVLLSITFCVDFSLQEKSDLFPLGDFSHKKNA